MTTHWKAILFALLAGLVIGWFDRGATEVEGTLLILLVVAFAQGLLTRAPSWMIIGPLFAGMPLAYFLAGAQGQRFNPGVVIVLIPIALAALAGRWAQRFLDDTARSALLPAGAQAPEGRAAISRATQPIYLILSAIVGCTILGLVPVYAITVARAQPFPWFVAIIWQVITFFGWLLVLGRLLRAGTVMNNPDRDGLTLKLLASHAAAVVAMVVLHAFVVPAATTTMHIPLGPNGFGVAVMWAMAAYLPLDALTWCVIVGIGLATDARERIRYSVMLEEAFRGQQATMRLASLQSQLRPHFLFNALNAGAVLAKRGDVDGAARVLTGLGDLLRYVLRGTEEGAGETQFVQLSEELTFAESYLAIEQERFPDRLKPSFDASTDVGNALVPHLLVQPLVENAVRHGVGGRIGAGRVEVRAWREGNALHVVINDDGPGTRAASTAESHGIGLSNTRSRLATLYGADAALELSDRPEGGASAHIRLPFRT